MASVVFDSAAFKLRYPEFVNVSDTLLGLCFDESCIYLSNTDNSPVQSIQRRTILLNMLTAHIAYLGGALSSDHQPRPVGALSSASEGSVSASFNTLEMTPGSGEWYKQTQYGAAFWQATSALRGFRYICQPTII